jgi:hypothetical protein
MWYWGAVGLILRLPTVTLGTEARKRGEEGSEHHSLRILSPPHFHLMCVHGATLRRGTAIPSAGGGREVAMGGRHGGEPEVEDDERGVDADELMEEGSEVLRLLDSRPVKG